MTKKINEPNPVSDQHTLEDFVCEHGKKSEEVCTECEHIDYDTFTDQEQSMGMLDIIIMEG